MPKKSRRQRIAKAASLAALRLGRYRGDGAPPIFVIGSGRSGNTLVRRVLTASGEIYIPPETYVLGEIIEIWPRTALLPWREQVWLFCAYFEKHSEFSTFGLTNLDDFAARAVALPAAERTLRQLIDAFYLHLAKAQDAPTGRWGDKTPYNTHHLPAIGTLYPEAKYLWLVRDGRDVALSYVEAGLYPDLLGAADRWTRANRACLSFARRGLDVRQQGYENLVTDPETAFADLFQWAGLEFAPDMLTILPGPMGDVEQRRHHEKVRRPISAASAGRWRGQLKPADLSTLPDDFWQVMHALGYATEGAQT
ncbi:sulfotransferase [Oceaniovalibus sp. ACAM 378]|uniref:sulfotransferase family protein n=1 Tax=Oceaniovalibus sp. ACAM 378 TaxID=2599923 RepID=UPI0011D5723C|nr:sulfotransferase [Oceaniovalibus sp. ACAM 378]TYB89509.1 sulfotransferase [Oceaniovalibus sp. ACAM 378]